jgi:hypothetical protein
MNNELKKVPNCVTKIFFMVLIGEILYDHFVKNPTVHTSISLFHAQIGYQMAQLVEHSRRRKFLAKTQETVLSCSFFYA